MIWWLAAKLRESRLSQLAEYARADAWCLALRADEPVPFWPVEFPSELEGVPADEEALFPGLW